MNRRKKSKGKIVSIELPEEEKKAHDQKVRQHLEKLSLINNLLKETCQDILFIFSQSFDADIREVVASNHNTPQLAIDKLAEDPNSRIRSIVAHHPNASNEIISKLSSDSNEQVRMAVASNGFTRLSIIEKLTNDNSERVAQAAKRYLDATNFKKRFRDKYGSDKLEGLFISLLINTPFNLRGEEDESKTTKISK